MKASRLLPFVLVLAFFASVGYSLLSNRFGTYSLVENAEKSARWQAAIESMTIAALCFVSQLRAVPRPRWLWFTFSAIGFMAMVAWIPACALHRPTIDIWQMVAIAFATGCVSCAFFVRGLSDNPYRIKKGVVIRHAFEPEHVVLMPVAVGKAMALIPHLVPDTWCILIQDNERPKGEGEGWLEFEDNVFGEYPIGSQYP